jgi:hypothetical protein
MNRWTIASSLGEGDYLPSGEYAVNVTGQFLQTHLGTIPFPPGETSALLFPVITRGSAAQPEFAIAGQRASTDTHGAAVWRKSTGWTEDPRLPVGTKPCIFDNLGDLIVNNGAAGAQGYRYVTPQNVVMTGDQTTGPLNGVYEWTDLSLAQDRSFLVGWNAWSPAAIVWDGKHHRLIEVGDAKFLTAHRVGDLVTVTMVKTGYASMIEGTVEEFLALPIYEQPTTPPPDSTPIGPVSPPRPADGQVYDIVAFLTTSPALQPRRGPTHPQHQTQPDATGLFFIIKFGDIIPTGRAYEMYRLDTGGYRHLEDASGSTPMHFTDTRWWPRHMAIGEPFVGQLPWPLVYTAAPTGAYISGQHQEVWDVRDPCRESHRDPVNRKMWLDAAWADFYWGPDLGHLETIRLAYDDTGGFYEPGRFVEVGYYARGAGWCRWEAHHAEIVYANPHGPAIFSDRSLSSRSDFYLVGGPVMTPELTGCVMAIPPDAPPWPSDPTPEPPKGPTVLYVFSSPNSFAVDECKKLDNGDGTLFAQRTKDNLYLSRDSGGNIHWVPTAASDETFILSTDGGALISRNLFPDAKHATFAAIPCKETL